MERNVGIWIDHKKAVLVTLTRSEEKITHVEAKDTSSPKASNNSHSPTPNPFGHKQYPAEDTRERQYEGHLHHFYEEVLATLGEVKSLLIVGPGEAKTEFRKQFEKRNHGAAVWVEPADRMTDAEFLKRVRDHFTGKAMEA